MMRILLMSDTHLGFSLGSERREDAFLAFEEGLGKAGECDALLLAGDIFDTRTPSPETFAWAMSGLFRLAHTGNGARVSTPSGKGALHAGVPVVAIHGNHERRVRGLVNPVEALEMGGFLIHLHCSTAVMEKGGERVAVHGMSAVPEQYAEQALKEWGPSPMEGAFNILMIHQNLEGFVRSENPLPKQSLPPGFDLYVCGDIHESHRSTVHGKPLLLPGSTVATQITKDAQNPRTFTLIDTSTGSLEQEPFRNQRRVFYREFEKRGEAERFLESTLAKSQGTKPVIRIKSPIPPDELKSRFGEGALLLPVQEREMTALTPEEQRLSVQESGKRLLEENLKKAGLDPKTFTDVFELLLEKRREDALRLLKRKMNKGPGKDGSEDEKTREAGGQEERLQDQGRTQKEGEGLPDSQSH